MKKSSLWVAAPLSLSLLTGVGCYTMLKHPQVEPAREAVAQAQAEEEFGFETRANRVSFGDNCRSCHDSNVATYHAIAVPYPVAEPSPRWSYYYETPWWFPYYASSGSSGNAESEEQKKRSFDRRRTSSSDESSYSGSAATPVPAPSSGSLAKPASEGNASSGASSQDANKRSDRRSSDGEKTESSRRERKP